MAVATGQARHVVVWRTVKEGSAARNAGGRPPTARPSPEAEGPLAWLLPVGMLSPVVQVAPYATRYMHDFGLTREQLAWIPVTQRAHAGRNPDAVYRDPLTVDDYLAARMISTPMCLYDCDVPVDGATAIVVSAAETAPTCGRRCHRGHGRRGRRPPVVGPVGGHEPGRARHRAALWARTDLRPADVDVAQLYDGFTIEVVWWLEAMGFCGAGEAGAFVEGGKRIGLDGELPLNTWGGQLSGGRLHAAFGHTAEAVRQLRGEAGDRQVPGRRGGGGDERGRLRGRRRAPWSTRGLAPRRSEMAERAGGSRGRWRSSPGRGRRPARGRHRQGDRRRAGPGGRQRAVVDLHPERAEETRPMIEDEGGKAEVFAADAPGPPTARRWSAAAVEPSATLDILVNNIGRAFAGHGRRHHRGGLGPGPRHQPAHRVPGLQVRRAGDGREAAGRSSTSRRSRRSGATARSPTRRPRAACWP